MSSAPCRSPPRLPRRKTTRMPVVQSSDMRLPVIPALIQAGECRVSAPMTPRPLRVQKRRTEPGAPLRKRTRDSVLTATADQ